MNKTEALLSSDTATVNHSELPVVSYSCSCAQKRSGNNFKAWNNKHTKESFVWKKSIIFIWHFPYDLWYLLYDTQTQKPYDTEHFLEKSYYRIWYPFSKWLSNFMLVIHITIKPTKPFRKKWKNIQILKVQTLLYFTDCLVR